ncbi:unnamed protein product [Amoebophrya sp. A25]|nr:unnamed protein product [Amoebophrya sp. A25]|eukprot:GSA25T00004725001.1
MKRERREELRARKKMHMMSQHQGGVEIGGTATSSGTLLTSSVVPSSLDNYIAPDRDELTIADVLKCVAQLSTYSTSSLTTGEDHSTPGDHSTQGDQDHSCTPTTASSTSTHTTSSILRLAVTSENRLKLQALHRFAKVGRRFDTVRQKRLTTNRVAALANLAFYFQQQEQGQQGEGQQGQGQLDEGGRDDDGRTLMDYNNRQLLRGSSSPISATGMFFREYSQSHAYWTSRSCTSGDTYNSPRGQLFNLASPLQNLNINLTAGALSASSSKNNMSSALAQLHRQHGGGGCSSTSNAGLQENSSSKQDHHRSATTTNSNNSKAIEDPGGRIGRERNNSGSSPGKHQDNLLNIDLETGSLTTTVVPGATSTKHGSRNSSRQYQYHTLPWSKVLAAWNKVCFLPDAEACLEEIIEKTRTLCDAWCVPFLLTHDPAMGLRPMKVSGGAASGVVANVTSGGDPSSWEKPQCTSDYRHPDLSTFDVTVLMAPAIALDVLLIGMRRSTLRSSESSAGAPVKTTTSNINIPTSPRSGAKIRLSPASPVVNKISSVSGGGGGTSSSSNSSSRTYWCSASTTTSGSVINQMLAACGGGRGRGGRIGSSYSSSTRALPFGGKQDQHQHLQSIFLPPGCQHPFPEVEIEDTDDRNNVFSSHTAGAFTSCSSSTSSDMSSSSTSLTAASFLTDGPRLYTTYRRVCTHLLASSSPRVGAPADEEARLWLPESLQHLLHMMRGAGSRTSARPPFGPSTTATTASMSRNKVNADKLVLENATEESVHHAHDSASPSRNQGPLLMSPRALLIKVASWLLFSQRLAFRLRIERIFGVDAPVVGMKLVNASRSSETQTASRQHQELGRSGSSSSLGSLQEEDERYEFDHRDHEHEEEQEELNPGKLMRASQVRNGLGTLLKDLLGGLEPGVRERPIVDEMLNSLVRDLETMVKKRREMAEREAEQERSRKVLLQTTEDDRRTAVEQQGSTSEALSLEQQEDDDDQNDPTRATGVVSRGKNPRGAELTIETGDTDLVNQEGAQQDKQASDLLTKDEVAASSSSGERQTTEEAQEAEAGGRGQVVYNTAAASTALSRVSGVERYRFEDLLSVSKSLVQLLARTQTTTQKIMAERRCSVFRALCEAHLTVVVQDETERQQALAGG